MGNEWPRLVHDNFFVPPCAFQVLSFLLFIAQSSDDVLLWTEMNRDTIVYSCEPKRKASSNVCRALSRLVAAGLCYHHIIAKLLWLPVRLTGTIPPLLDIQRWTTPFSVPT